MEGFVEEVSKYFSPDGSMKEIIPNYIYRQEQVSLSQGIAKALSDNEFLIAEAGTGIGKTYAYLIPAVLWSIREGKKVIVSTKTKALQQQIVERDIPDIKKVLDCDFSCAEAKGRENYLCWNKYMNIVAGKKSLEPEEVEFVQAILSWAEQTKTGDKIEITVESRLMKHWLLIGADRNSCQKDMCRYHDKCFRLKMIKRLQKANIIIVNHSLLLSDIMVDNSILPEYEYLIIDEAHNFDREAFDKLSTSFVFAEIVDLLKMLYWKDRKFSKGYLKHIKKAFPTLQMYINEAEILVDRATGITFTLHDLFNQVMEDEIEYNFSRVLNQSDLESSWFNKVINMYLEWQAGLSLLIKKLESIKEEIIGEAEEADLQVIIGSLYEYSDKAFTVMEEHLNQEDKIVWLELNGNKVSSIASSSIRIGEILKQRLHEKLSSMIMVSATLAIEDNFDYFMAKCGLETLYDEGRVNTILEKSPFAYEKQAALYIVEDMPAPDGQSFNQELVSVLTDIFSVVGGKTLVLFTAKRQMLEVAALLRPVCSVQGIRLLVQYEDGESSSIVNEYINSANTVLMGLETFWEGIDLKGELLECVVIVKLPFRSPSDPFASASDKYYRSQNKNSFSNFMLPDAAVRFKQGVGRLIRSEEDRGIVIVLDNRLEKRSYGTVFKNSIPIKNVNKVSRKELSGSIREWL